MQGMRTKSAAHSRSGRGGKKHRLSYADFEQNNPMRPLAWRWERAGSLIDHRLSSSRDDSWTLRAARYLKDLERADTECQRDKCANRYADVEIAWLIHNRGEMMRWLIEARVLAGQPLEAIAKEAAVPVAVIEAYEALFFQVRDRLELRGFIVLRTMMKIVRGEVTEDDVDVLLKWLGYFGGPLAIDAAVPFLLTPMMDLRVLPDEHRRLGQKVRLLVKALTMPVNSANDGKFFRAALAIMRHQRDEAASQAPPGLSPGKSPELMDELVECLGVRIEEPRASVA